MKYDIVQSRSGDYMGIMCPVIQIITMYTYLSRHNQWLGEKFTSEIATDLGVTEENIANIFAKSA